MKGKQPSPQDKTQLRIAKDKREFDRLTKAAKKRLVEGHSPTTYDYVNYALSRLEGPVKEGRKTVDDGIGSSVTDMEHYFTNAEKVALETVDPWSAEAKLILKTAEERSFGYLYRKEDEAEQSWDNANQEAIDRVNALRDAEGNLLREIDDQENYWYNQRADQFNAFLDDAKINGGDFDIGWMDALGMIPEIIWGMGKMIDSFVNLDPEKFIEDNIELAKVQKRLQERLKAEEI